MCTLLNKTGYKRIVECTNNRLWGTGVPLNRAECLDQSKWTSQGVLGEILEEIHLETRSTMFTIPPPCTDSNRHQVNNTMPSISVTGTVQPHQLPHSVAAWNTTYQADTTPHSTPTTSETSGATLMHQMPLHAAIWNNHSQPLPNYLALPSNAQTRNTILEPAATNTSSNHGKCETDPKSLETVSISKNNSTNAEAELRLTTQTESTTHIEVEMMETIPNLNSISNSN